MSELKAWKFCPECGCREYIQENHLGEHSRVCKGCGQEWWTDINYWNTRPNDAKWISVEDELPEEATHVLVWFPLEVMMASNRNGKWEDSLDGMDLEDEGITHWMPLPTTP